MMIDNCKNVMLNKLSEVRHLIGNTPIHSFISNGMKVSAKLEQFNFFNSIKDRPAYHIVSCAIENGDIAQHTKVVESSSGNFAISIANICKHLGLEFVPVVDKNINKHYLDTLNAVCSRIIMVEERDVTGGYLLGRLEKVKEFCAEQPGAFWTQQYYNPNNYRAYYSLADEIYAQCPDLTHVFIAVSSGGTITGVSRKIKQLNPRAKVIAVDIEGSVIFNCPPKSRFISGLGSSIRPPLVDKAEIDRVIHVTHEEIIAGCHNLYNESLVFGGGSSGAVHAAMGKYFAEYPEERNGHSVIICPDKGNGYADTIYNQQWIKQMQKKLHNAIPE